MIISRPVNKGSGSVKRRIIRCFTSCLFVTVAFCCASQENVSAATWECDTAYEMIRPKKVGDTFSSGWRLEEAECSETGVYYYTFTLSGSVSSSSNSSSKVILALNIGAEGSGGAGKSSKSVFIEQSGGGVPTSDVSGIEAELLEGADRWESRVNNADRMVMLLYALLMALSVAWISKVAERARKGVTSAAANLSLMLASLVFVLCAVEVGFRVFNISPKDSGLMSFMSEVRDQAILYGGFRRLEKTLPGAANSDGEVNAVGYRLGNYTMKKKPGTVRVVCVGDSFMFGIGVKTEWTFPEDLQRNLKETPGAPAAEAVNLGMPGSSATDITSLLLTETPMYDPDVIVYGYVLNDIDLGNFLDHRAFYDGVGIKPKALQRVIDSHDLGGLRKYSRIYHLIAGIYEDRLLNNLVLDMYSGSYNPERNPEGISKLEYDFKLIKDNFISRGVPVVLMIYPILVDFGEKYPYANAHRRVAEMGEKAGMQVLDLLPYYSGKDPSKLWASRTDHHPNMEGQQIAADAAANFILSHHLLREGGRRTADEAAGIKDVIAHAKAALDQGQPVEALTLISNVITAAPNNCDLHELAAYATAERGASRAVVRKAKRMKIISPECAARAAKIEDSLRKTAEGITVR